MTAWQSFYAGLDAPLNLDERATGSKKETIWEKCILLPIEKGNCNLKLKISHNRWETIIGAFPSIRRSRAHGAYTASARREEEAMRGHR